MAEAYPPKPDDHTPAEWEPHREAFTRLYITENKPLREVQEIMREL
jgi:hypothetical protein